MKWFGKSEDQKLVLEEKETNINSKDIIAPPSIEIKEGHIKIGKIFARSFFVVSYPNKVTENWLAPIIQNAKVFDLSLYIKPTASEEVLEELQQKVTDIEATIEERKEKGLVRDPELELAYKNIESLRDKLISVTEKMFKFSIYYTLYASEKTSLDKLDKSFSQLFSSRLVYAKPASLRHHKGINTIAPIFYDQLQTSSLFNTSPLSAAFPFVSLELTSDKGVLYGINEHNNSLVIFDRFSLANANMTVFGVSGGGKSYFVKTEILRSLIFGTDIIIIDPENEYKYLSEAVGGTNFSISLLSSYHINPLDLPPKIEEETPESAFRSNIINLIGFLRLCLGGLTAEEESILNRALNETYALKDITPQNCFEKRDNPPLLGDLYKVLKEMKGGGTLATKLEKYVNGAYAGFLNNPTNIQLSNNPVVFSIRDLERELRPIGMYMILKHIWTTIRAELKKRLLIMDEAWVMMQQEDSASFLYRIVKRARKYYLGVTTITQDVNDFMGTEYGEPVVANSALQFLLRQSAATIDTVDRTFNLTKKERDFIRGAEIGEGLFFAGKKHVALKVVASYNEDQLITTSPQEILEIKEAKKELEEQGEAGEGGGKQEQASPSPKASAEQGAQQAKKGEEKKAERTQQEEPEKEETKEKPKETRKSS